jgi:hypothetical protein
MGIVTQSVRINGQAPPLQRIIDEINRIAGLPLHVEESNAEVKGGVFDLHARIAFNCLRSHDIQVYTYQPGAVQSVIQGAGRSGPGLARVIEGGREPPGTQTVVLLGYAGQELSIMYATVLALESLGGTAGTPVDPKIREEFATVRSAKQLKLKAARLRLFGFSSSILAILFFPFIRAYMLSANIIAAFGHRRRLRRG